jgi:hypothetical protein
MMRFEDMNEIQQKLHNLAIVQDLNGDKTGASKICREAIDSITASVAIESLLTHYAAALDVYAHPEEYDLTEPPTDVARDALLRQASPSAALRAHEAAIICSIADSCNFLPNHNGPAISGILKDKAFQHLTGGDA